MGLSVDLQVCMKARALLGKQRHETEHIPALPYSEAPKFYRWLCTLDTTASRALRFLKLTLARTSEVRLATSDEIESDVWSLADKRTKTNEGPGLGPRQPAATRRSRWNDILTRGPLALPPSKPVSNVFTSSAITTPLG
ncbi:MAG: hypothetical protein DI606_09675 [Sphingobium sp.]|uniref:hypothetical protein n=1 Tax=Sphingobium sp. TaxID=1912891 RepID=UPI000DB264CF|nr:hypothetical protein [Sphingobium sp.]PZU12338.1 MAG: hypothetical protein DI606_09675 [Sphingobium sp.]